MKRLKRAGRFLCSMKCAIVLLLILVAVCVAGSLIPQGEAANYYTSGYSETVAGAILLLGLDDIFHCWWFVGLTLFLCVNLLSCNLLRFPAILKRMRCGFSLEKCILGWDKTGVVRLQEEPRKLFEDMGFKHVERQQLQDGMDALYGTRHKAGIWGPWLCHLGMIIVIAGFGLGQLYQEQYTVYGVPGQTKAIGDTGYDLHIDSFEIKLREDDTVEQYITALTISGGSGQDASSAGGETSVNMPLSLFGMKIYQNSTGWAAGLEVWKDGEKLQEELLCAGEYALVKDLDGLAVMLSAFYPDYGQDGTGMPVTLSSRLNNPAYLYTLYYHDRILGMDVLTGDEKITVEDYTLIFKDPQPYTLLQIKKDPFTWLAAVGGLIVLLSLFLAFYIQPEELWAVKEEDGSWIVSGRSRREGTVFLEKIAAKSKVKEESDNEQ